MNSFEAGFLERLPINHNLLRTVRLLGEYRGKEALYKQQAPQVLETLQQVAVIQSTESSNRIEGVVAPLKRIQELVAQKTTPRGRSEQEIAGYRDVLGAIHAGHAHISFTPGVVQQLHRDLFRYTSSPSGQWKALDNEISDVQPNGTRVLRFRPVSAIHTPEAMERLHARFDEEWAAGQIEPLVLMAAYILDFLCIHPFSDGNGRMARLLGLLLLYRGGFEVGRYISLEKIIEESKESYYDSLYSSSQGWHELQHELLPWMNYYLGVLIAAYREFEGRVGTLTFARGSKSQMVHEAIRHLPDGFRMADLERTCPGVSRSMIRVILNDLRNDGEIWCEGAGPAAVWRKRAGKS